MKKRFNPFKPVSSQYGAPMGRCGHSFTQYGGGALKAQHCGGDGYYDRGGAYWGHSKVYAVYTKGGAFCAYVEANSKADAIKQVQKETGIYHNIKIYDNGGETYDRYTAVFTGQVEKFSYGGFGKKPEKMFLALGFNENPYHPQGFGQHTTAMPGKHLGKKIDFADLPEKARQFVEANA